MMLLFWCEIADIAEMPDFGPDFFAHMQQKTHPEVLRASRSAWKLLALALRRQGYAALPRVLFSDRGKPCFQDVPLHFSLSHSGGIAAVLLSDAPCGVDVELRRPEVQARLLKRCMTADETAAGLDFFEVWTKKECIAKLEGCGLSAQLLQVSVLDSAYAGRFFSCALTDSAGRQYVLSALGANAAQLQAERETII